MKFRSSWRGRMGFQFRFTGIFCIPTNFKRPSIPLNFFITKGTSAFWIVGAYRWLALENLRRMEKKEHVNLWQNWSDTILRLSPAWHLELTRLHCKRQ